MPGYCPLCNLDGLDEEALCPECGDRPVLQGYCGVCERFWNLPVGALCPKHEIKLDPGDPSPKEFLTDEATTWVTVATFADDVQAEARRIRLEAEGIPTFLEGSRMGSRSMYTVATGGVKLQVPESLSADARIVLSQSWTPADDDLDDAWDELTPEPWIARRQVMRGVILLILAAPFLMILIALVLDLLG
jgi:hypothetical protein